MKKYQNPDVKIMSIQGLYAICGMSKPVMKDPDKDPFAAPGKVKLY